MPAPLSELSHFLVGGLGSLGDRFGGLLVDNTFASWHELEKDNHHIAENNHGVFLSENEGRDVGSRQKNLLEHRCGFRQQLG